MRSVAAALLLAFAAGCGSGGATTGSDPLPGGEPVASDLVVVNWNIRDFVNDKNDSGDPAELVVSTDDYSARLDGIAALLSELEGDILVLQEVENTSVLSDHAPLSATYVITAP